MSQVFAPSCNGPDLPGVLHDPAGLPSTISELARYVHKKGCHTQFDHDEEEVGLTIKAPHQQLFNSNGKPVLIITELVHHFTNDREQEMVNIVLANCSLGFKPNPAAQRRR